MTTTTQKPPIWFWIISIIALLWNAMGVLAYIGQAFLTEEAIAAMPPEQQEIYSIDFPAWYTAAFAIAVFAGFGACILLLLRKKLANIFFIVSFPQKQYFSLIFYSYFCSIIKKLNLMKAYIFPGQGAQFTGMGLDLYENSPEAQHLFEDANSILGFNITDIMFEGTADQLKETKVTQPAIFLHSVILAKTLGDSFKPDMVAGHSLGEFSALVANGALSFEDGLKLVSQRAMAMQKACEIQPSTMAAVLGLED